MARFELIDAINDPGTPGKSGDDRYGFDLAGGVAWVFDGATDVSTIKPFPDVESGAAWVAQALSDRLLALPAADEPPQDYFCRAIEDVRARAEAESAIDLETAPAETWPIAAGVWARLETGAATFAWLGDCLALLRRNGSVETIGSPDKPEAETAQAKALIALGEEAMWARLRDARRRQNSGEDGGTWIFGLDSTAADHLNIRDAAIAEGDELLMMSDGLYRLISPYRSHTPESLFELLDSEGLGGAIAALRSQETDAADNAAVGRIKTRDDACGLWLRVVD